MNNAEILIALVAGSIGAFVLNLIGWTYRLLWRRLKILWALQKQLEIIPRTNQHNTTATESLHVPPIEYPVEPFEIALFGYDGMSLNQKTIHAATEYLVMARKLNAVIRVLQEGHLVTQPAHDGEGVKETTRRFLHDQAERDMSCVVPPLQEALKCEQHSAIIHLAIAIAIPAILVLLLLSVLSGYWRVI